MRKIEKKKIFFFLSKMCWTCVVQAKEDDVCMFCKVVYRDCEDGFDWIFHRETWWMMKLDVILKILRMFMDGFVTVVTVKRKLLNLQELEETLGKKFTIYNFMKIEEKNFSYLSNGNPKQP